MASTIKATNISTPDGTGNITVDRPLSGSGASLTNLPAGNLTGTIPDARFPATLPASSGANLTALPAGNLTGTVADARISTLTASKLTGALPAISGASLTGISAGAFKQIVTSTGTTYGATSTASYVDIAGCSASITTTGGSSTVMVQLYTGGQVSHPAIRGFAAIQNYTADSTTQFQESAIVIGDNDSGTPAQKSFSNGCVIHVFTGLAAQTWNFRGRWRMHAANGSFNNSRAEGAMLLWELA